MAIVAAFCNFPGPYLSRAVKILTTRSSAGIGSFSLFLHLSFTCLSPINVTRHSTPVMMAPTFTEVIFLNIKMTIWKQYATHFNWLLSAGLVFNLVLHHKTLRHPILNQPRIALIFFRAFRQLHSSFMYLLRVTISSLDCPLWLTRIITLVMV